MVQRSVIGRTTRYLLYVRRVKASVEATSLSVICSSVWIVRACPFFQCIT